MDLYPSCFSIMCNNSGLVSKNFRSIGILWPPVPSLQLQVQLKYLPYYFEFLY